MFRLSAYCFHIAHFAAHAAPSTFAVSSRVILGFFDCRRHRWGATTLYIAYAAVNAAMPRRRWPYHGRHAQQLLSLLKRRVSPPYDIFAILYSLLLHLFITPPFCRGGRDYFICSMPIFSSEQMLRADALEIFHGTFRHFANGSGHQHAVEDCCHD